MPCPHRVFLEHRGLGCGSSEIKNEPESRPLIVGSCLLGSHQDSASNLKCASRIRGAVSWLQAELQAHLNFKSWTNYSNSLAICLCFLRSLILETETSELSCGFVSGTGYAFKYVQRGVVTGNPIFSCSTAMETGRTKLLRVKCVFVVCAL